MSPVKQTVIVGAGFAGLWIADKMVATGVPGSQILVLEKYDYLGGRVVSASRPDGTSYEIGAGRIHKSHHRVSALINRYGLKTYDLDGSIHWLPKGPGPTQPEPNRFEAVWNTLLSRFKELPPDVLGSHTLRELSMKVWGPQHTHELLQKFPYRAETEVLRADMALRTFKDTLGTQEHYYVVVGGLSALITRMVTELKKAGVRFRLDTEVTNVSIDDRGVYEVRVKDKEPIHAARVILALHATALQKLPILREFSPLQHLSMRPLTRIYAQYPVDPATGVAWFAPFGRIVTDSPLRYIIPINPKSGLTMISYTDDQDTHVWKGLQKKPLQDAIQAEVRRLFPHLTIPEPTWIKSYEWKDGCTYWLPGDYDPHKESQQALQPRPSTMPHLYVCGESFSLLQAWMEGALEHAEALWDTHLQKSLSAV
jgi:monoamine oxidase